LLCDVCLGRATPLKGGFCRRCARDTGGPDLCHACAESPPTLSRLIAVYQFDGAIRDAVHALKYKDIRALGPVLGELMADDPRVVRLAPDSIVPVPLHPRRERSRGYNQAALLARPIAGLFAAPIATHLLRRTADIRPQVEAHARSARARNVIGIFEAAPDVPGKQILLVDDVATTGSTLRECAWTLLKAGARRVDAVVLAKEI
jgi:ComF family protein